MSAIRHGNPGEWAKAKGTVMSLWPIFLCCVALGACGASIALGRYAVWFAGAFALCVVITAVLWRKGLRRVESYFKGARGEERVAAVLDTLPSSWHVFHDFVAGRHHVDHVLVGPTGVYAIETKNWRGHVAVETGEMIVDGRLADRQPLVQTQRQADAVKAAIRKAGLECEVVPVLCLASDTFVEKIQPVGRTTVLNASCLADWIQGGQGRCSANEIARLAQLMETNI